MMAQTYVEQHLAPAQTHDYNMCRRLSWPAAEAVAELAGGRQLLMGAVSN